MPRIVDYPLQEVEVGRDYVISRVSSHDADKLRYFDTLGIKPGATLHFAHQAPFNGPLQINLGDEIVHLGHELAGVLRVCSQEEFELV
jgi:Fe2+ transport system protein FeoA